MKKTCTKCLKKKKLDDFPKCSRKKDGHLPRCKECTNDDNKNYRESNNSTFKKMRKRYYDKNISVINEKRRTKYTKTRAEKKSKYDKEYRKSNKEKIRNWKKEWSIKQRKENPIFKIKNNLRRRIHHLLKDGYKSEKTEKLIGCTFEEFKTHIEKQFKQGMNWENYGSTWHIDHKTPCASFDLTVLEEQYKCFHYSNQQPLWAIENLKKSKKI